MSMIWVTQFHPESKLSINSKHIVFIEQLDPSAIVIHMTDGTSYGCKGYISQILEMGVPLISITTPKSKKKIAVNPDFVVSVNLSAFQDATIIQLGSNRQLYCEETVQELHDAINGAVKEGQ